MTRPRLRDAIASPSGKQPYVNRLFARIADRYDLITVLLSYGLDRRWKRRLVRMAAVLAGDRAIDLACGTGDLTYAIAIAGAERATGLDITAPMLAIARAKQRAPQVPRVTFVRGDMMALPYRDASATLVTAGYGLRNVPDTAGALREVFRVLAPGGRFFSLDFGHPRRPLFDRLYLTYLTIVGSTLGLVLHGDPDTYRYIPASLALYPPQPEIAALMTRIGFIDTGWQNLIGGMMAIHYWRKPARGW